MGYKFTYCGGGAKPNLNSNIKFFLFFVAGGDEIPLYRALTDGLVKRAKDSSFQFDLPNQFTTSLNVAKIFTSYSKFGDPKQYYSFYFKFRNPAEYPMIKITGFGDWPGYLFEGCISFLKRSEILSLLGEESSSRGFVERQRTLPIETLRKLVTVDRSDLLKGVRHIRIGRKNTNGS